MTWLKEIIQGKHVLVRHLREGLGRLGFASGVLEWSKPFLAPVYSWTAVAPQGAFLPIPPVIKLTLSWILEQLQTGKFMTPCAKRINRGTVFKADTKGESDHIILGGWECFNNTPTQRARWFSVKVTKEMAPWLFEKGHGSRTIAASEMLASLFCVLAFIPAGTNSCKGEVEMTGITDNQGNSFIVSKLLTTKWPGAPVLMELTSQLASRGMWLNLQWRPREQNSEADDLTNEVYDRFDQSLRIPMCFEDILECSLVLKRYLALGTAFYGDLDTIKAANLEKRKREPRGSSGGGAQKKNKFKKKVSTLSPW
jgi:hypothetical protein